MGNNSKGASLALACMYTPLHIHLCMHKRAHTHTNTPAHSHAIKSTKAIRRLPHLRWSRTMCIYTLKETENY